MIQFVAIILGAIALVIGLYLLALELQYRHSPKNRLVMTSGHWHLTVNEPQRYVLVGHLDLVNQTQRLELMVPQVWADASLLSGGSLEGISTKVRVASRHEDVPARPDGYWYGYIVKVKGKTSLEVTIDISGSDLSQLKAVWIQVHYIVYGPVGCTPNVRHVVFPLQHPDPADSKNWRMATGAEVLPIRTHLLTPLDSPVEVVRRYVLPHAKPGDVVTIGESPVAIMQDRFRDPRQIKPGWVATRLCLLFLPTSSLATACGMQALVDLVGPLRVLFAFLVGAIAKLVLRQRGVFYQLAGEQARLIDDLTGTLPPYDQFIVLGPEDPQRVVEEIKYETGIAAAIVDVNDLKAVKILAATSEVSPQLLHNALLKNPAGNADEQTPVVLIRPLSNA